MLSGEVYSAVAPELLEELMVTREMLYEYNSLHPSETRRMKEILKGLLGYVADAANGSLPTSISRFSMKPVLLLVMIVSSALMSASTLPAIVPTLLNVIAARSGLSLSPLAITYG